MCPHRRRESLHLWPAFVEAAWSGGRRETSMRNAETSGGYLVGGANALTVEAHQQIRDTFPIAARSLHQAAAVHQSAHDQGIVGGDLGGQTAEHLVRTEVDEPMP